MKSNFNLNNTTKVNKKSSLFKNFNFNLKKQEKKENKEKKENELKLFEIMIDKNKDKDEILLNQILLQMLILYKTKKYEIIISSILSREHLLFKQSNASFNLIFIKIKCKLKIFKNNLNVYFSKNKKEGLFELEEYLNEIQIDINKLLLITNKNNTQYEKITQVLSIKLYYNAFINKIQENQIKYFSNLNLAYNMLKFFYLKNNIAQDFNTYKIFCLILLNIISFYIEDYNFSQAFYYENLLLNTCGICIKLCNLNKNTKFIHKFINFLFCDFLFIGLTYEYVQEDDNSFDTYKNACHIIDSVNISCGKLFRLCRNLKERFRIKFINDKIEKQLEYQKNLEKIKIEEEKKRSKNKKDLLFRLSHGIYEINNRYENFENNLNNKYFDAKQLNLINKLDKDLFNIFNNETFNIKSYHKKNLSSDIQKNLYHLDIYNTLLKKNYHKFITENKNFEFNYPKNEKKTIYILNNFITKNMEKSMKSHSNKHKYYKNNFKTSSTTLSMRLHLSDKSLINDYGSKRLNSTYLIKNNNNSNKSIKLIKNKNKSRPNLYKPLANDFDKKYIDKILLSKKFYNKYSYLDKISNREIEFQKKLLKTKKNNYFNEYFSNENNLSNDKIEKDAEIKFLYINNNIKEKLNEENNINNNNDSNINEKINKHKINYKFGNTFSNLTHKGKKIIISSFSELLKKYLKKKYIIEKNKKKLENKDFISQNNEIKINEIGKEIENINKIILNYKNKK